MGFLCNQIVNKILMYKNEENYCCTDMYKVKIIKQKIRN